MEDFFKLMNNSVYDKTIKKMSFWDERDIFRLMNNSVYGKTIHTRFNNAKKYEAYINEFLG